MIKFKNKAWKLYIFPYKIICEALEHIVKSERDLLKIKLIMPKGEFNLKELIRCDHFHYQKLFRIYLDEYENQKTLKKEWFNNRYDKLGINKFITKRFLERK